ncbi:unnamed protein product, partial [Musa acuminata subsp. burmannicoides]
SPSLTSTGPSRGIFLAAIGLVFPGPRWVAGTDSTQVLAFRTWTNRFDRTGAGL